MALRIVNGWRDLEPGCRGASLGLGNFDGVHLGHRRVIGLAAEAARALGAPLGVIGFDPHPYSLFRPDSPPYRLTSPAQQMRAFQALGVERLHRIAFDRELAGLSAEDFAGRVLAEGLGAVHVSAGFDVTFGKGRSGDAERLARLGERYGFGVSIARALNDEAGRKISSSAAREAVGAGDMALAADILGRPFAIEGVVVPGRRLGRALGFPTANVALGDYVRPRFGAYATRTRLPDGRIADGAASVGINPALPVEEARLEVWLFDFDEDLYGRTIETELIAWLRPEAAFDDLEALKAQIAADGEAARAILARLPKA